MQEEKGPKAASKISRHNLVQNTRDKFYANLNNVYKENKNAPVLEAAPSTKKPLPPKPTTGTFSRTGAAPAKPVSRTQRVGTTPLAAASSSTTNLRA